MTNLKVTDVNNNSHKQTTYRIAIDPNSLIVHSSSIKSLNLNINDTVKNINGLLGTVTKKTDSEIFVQWNDNSFERIRLANINDGYLSYVDTIETQVNPLEPSTGNPNLIDDRTNKHTNNHTNKHTNEATKDTNKDTEKDVNNENNNKNNEENIDMEKIKLQKKVADLENQLQNRSINKVKTRAAEELVDLAIAKGMIDADDKDLEIIKVSAYDDETFQKYEQDVLSYNLEGDVSSLEESTNTNTLGMTKEEIEAHNMLHKKKFELGIPTNKYDFSTAERRSTKEIGNKSEITFANIANIQKPKSLEDALLSLNSLDNESSNNYEDEYEYESAYENDMPFQTYNNSLQTMAPAKKQKAVVAKNNSGFLNVPLQGITKPLLLGQSKVSFGVPSNTEFEGLAQLDWTTVSR